MCPTRHFVYIFFNPVFQVSTAKNEINLFNNHVLIVAPVTFAPAGAMTPSAEFLFSLYIYIEKFKNLLVRNHWTDFNIILQKCFFGDPLPRLFKPFGFVKKHGRQGAGLIFPIYLYRKL